MANWTDFLATPAALYEGMAIRQPGDRITSHVAEAAVRAGYLVAFGTDRLTNQLQVQPIPAAPVADVDAIATAAGFVSAAAAQILETAAELDGAVGLGRIYPPQCIGVHTDADAGWDGPLGYTPFWVYGEDASGKKIDEEVIRNNVGAVAQNLYTFQAFSKVDRFDVGASNAATGTGTIGTDPRYLELGVLDYPGIACYDMAREPSATATVTFDALETLSVCRKGLVAVTAQSIVAPGDPVFVRITAGGGIAVGAFYGTQEKTATAAFARLLGARWRTAAAAGALAVVEVGL